MSEYIKDAKAFWNWFTEKQYEYYVIESLSELKQEQLLDQLLEQLQLYCADLYFEISSNLDNKQELIISAGGDLSLFTLVDSLVQSAPEFAKWNIIALKPPVLEDFELNYEGISINTKDLYFVPLKNIASSKIAIRLYLDRFKKGKEKEYLAAAWIILDSVLGERLCAEDIEFLDIEGIPNPDMIQYNIDSGALFPLSALRNYISRKSINK